ncbi:MAG: hypothetical protein Q8K01_15225 [Sulfurimicrobium sp.]|nr:hypothetical protein [Sulfurimicrobium sp.]
MKKRTLMPGPGIPLPPFNPTVTQPNPTKHVRYDKGFLYQENNKFELHITLADEKCAAFSAALEALLDLVAIRQ